MGSRRARGVSSSWFVVRAAMLLLVLFAAFAMGCSCGGNGSAGTGTNSTSTGAGGNVQGALKAVIKVTPPSIPRGDNFATQVSLDGSASSGMGTLTYTWDIGQGKVASGDLKSSKLVATFEGLDNAAIVLTVSDGHGTATTSAVVRIQSPPVIIVAEEASTNEGTALTIDASKSFDRDGDPLTFAWSIKDGPMGGQVTGMAGGKATFNTSVPGDYKVALSLTAGGQTVDATTIVHVLPTPQDQEPIGVTVTAVPSVAAKGTTVNFQITLNPVPKGPATVVLRAGSKIIPVQNLQASQLFDVPGDYPVVADVYAPGRGGRGRASLDIYDPAEPDNGPPVVSLTSPAPDARITSTVKATGTATDSDLAAYYLEARQQTALDSEPWQVLATGTSSVVNAVLGNVEVTLLRQTDYRLRLRAVDRRGHSSVVEQKLTVDYARARGDLRFVLTDFKSSLSGPPITVWRSYDSLDRQVGDFGYGWTLATSGNGSVTRANTVGEGWDPTGTDCIFNFSLSELENHLITVSIGDQRQFYAPTPQITSCITGAVIVSTNFTRLDAGQGTLSVEHQGDDLLIPFGDNNMYRFDAAFDPTMVYDPNDYTVTNADASTATFSNGGKGGNPKLTQMRDALGNGFDVSDDQNTIKHTSGATVALKRNAAGRVTSLTRPDGKTRSYVYNSAQELISASDFDGRTRRFFYGPDHLLTRILGPRGNVLFDARYDDNARLVQAVDGTTDTPAVTTYDTPNHKESTLLPDGVSDTSTYDDNGNTTTRTLNDLTVESYSTDAQNRALAYTNRAGETTSLTYDANNRPTKVNPQGEGDFTLGYDQNGFISSMDTPRGMIIYQRDASGHVTHMAAGSGLDVKMDRDGSGKIAHVDMNGYTMDLTHNAAGYTTSVAADGKTFNYDVNGVGDITGIHYKDGAEQNDIAMDVDSDGVPVTITAKVNGVMVAQQQQEQDAEGKIGKDGAGHEVILNGHGQARHLLDPSGAVMSREFDDNTGHLKAITRPEGGRIAFAKDPMTGDQVTIYPDGNQRVVKTDAQGRPAKTLEPGGLVTQNFYDAQGRLTATTGPDGLTDKLEYNAAGQVGKHTFPTGVAVELTYDAAGHMVTRKTGVRPAFQYVYNGNAIAKITSPTGSVMNETYDAEGHVASVGYQNGPPATAYVHAGGRLVSVTDSAGHTRSFTLAKLGTERKETRPSGSFQTVTNLPDGSVHTVDFDGRGVTLVTDPKTQLSTRTADDGTKISVSHDRDGNIDGYEDPSGKTSFSRDVSGRVLVQALPDGHVLRFDYHKTFGTERIKTPSATDTLVYAPSGRLKTVDLDGKAGIDVGYDAGGRPASYTLGDLVVSEARDSEGLVSNVSVKFAGNVLLSDDVKYDDDGRPVSVASNVGMGRSFTYDKADRLITDSDVSFGYDAASNLTTLGPRTFTFDADDHVTGDGSTTFQTDKSGHLLSGPDGTKLEWDAFGRLTKVTRAGKTVSYGYDPTGLIASRNDGTEDRRFVWSMNASVPMLVEEYDGKTGDVLAHNTHLGRLLVRVAGGHRYAIVHDSFSNARMVVDETGKVVDTREYTAYGQLRAGTITMDTAFGFSGAWTDPVTGFVYMRNRWYAPELGRFLSEDPEEPRLDAGITLNRFQYANGMPTVFIDPLGRQGLGEVLVAMAGYGNLRAQQTVTSMNFYASFASQFIALGLAEISIDRSGIFKFMQDNKRWIPTSIVLGANVNAVSLGMGVTFGMEVLGHYMSRNFSPSATPYCYWGGPTSGPCWLINTLAGYKPKEDFKWATLTGGIIGSNVVFGIGGGFSFYTGLAWDVIHPGAYEGPFAALSAPPALLVPFITLNLLVQTDGGVQLGALGLGGGAGIALGANALKNLGPAMGGVMNAAFNAWRAAVSNPNQIWIKQPPPTTAALNDANSNFMKELTKWSEKPSMQIAWSPEASETPLCTWDAKNQKWIDCKKAQSWSITYNFFGKSGGLPSNRTFGPQLFQYSYTVYNCLFDGAPGWSCGDNVDINDIKGGYKGPVPEP